MTDVMISYGRDQEALAAKVAKALAADGYDVWWDENIPAHRAYGALIEEKVRDAKAVLVIWSASAAKSEWVRAEADLARNQQKLIQISVDDTLPPLPFNQIQFAPIKAWDGTPEHPEWRRVRASLQTLCGGKGVKPPGPWDVPAAAPDQKPARAAVSTPAALRRQPFFLIAAGVLAAAGFAVMLTQRDGAGPITVPGPLPAPAAAPVAPKAAPTTPQPATPPSPSPSPPEASPSDFILPNSGSQPLSAIDIATLDKDQLRIARNEIYARHGRIFKSPELAAHFARFAWYRPLAESVTLTPVEQANVELLQAAEGRR